MGKKKSKRKTIIVANISNLPEAEFVETTGGMGKAMTDNPTYVVGIDPEGSVVTAKVDLLTKMFLDRDSLFKAFKAKTVSIGAAIEDIKGIIVDKWCGQVQAACGDDPEKYNALGFYAKGQGNGKAAIVVGMAVNTYPAITEIDTHIHLTHVLTVLNSESGKRGKPKDADRTDVYMQIGGLVPPNDIKNMTNINSVSNGKLIHKFDVADLGKTIYYIAVYVSLKNKQPMTMGVVASAVLG